MLQCLSFVTRVLRLEFPVAFFLGIDGGGSKTRCIVGDEDSELGSGISGSSKVQRVGEACARDSLSAAIHEACAQAGVSPRKIIRTCAGITGAARPEIAGLMQDLLISIVGGEIEIVGDVEVAFEDAFGGGPGVIVIAGTGSIAYGRGASGETARAGGWGYPVSDQGSGYWIGVEAVAAALRAKDRGEDPAFLKEVIRKLGAKDFDDLIVRMNTHPAPDFATLFPLVLSAGEGGDAMTAEVLRGAGKELARLAESVIVRLFSKRPASVATHGGVFLNGTMVKKVFEQELQHLCRNATALHRTIDPARGALQRARRDLNAAGATQ